MPGICRQVEPSKRSFEYFYHGPVRLLAKPRNTRIRPLAAAETGSGQPPDGE